MFDHRTRPLSGLTAWILFGGHLLDCFPCMTHPGNVSDPRPTKIWDLLWLVKSLHCPMFKPVIWTNHREPCNPFWGPSRSRPHHFSEVNSLHTQIKTLHILRINGQIFYVLFVFVFQNPDLTNELAIICTTNDWRGALILNAEIGSVRKEWSGSDVKIQWLSLEHFLVCWIYNLFVVPFDLLPEWICCKIIVWIS